jgi:hypothetical protein
VKRWGGGEVKRGREEETAVQTFVAPNVEARLFTSSLLHLLTSFH